jgi:hypothetical protein
MCLPYDGRADLLVVRLCHHLPGDRSFEVCSQRCKGQENPGLPLIWMRGSCSTAGLVKSGVEEVVLIFRVTHRYQSAATLF